MYFKGPRDCRSRGADEAHDSADKRHAASVKKINSFDGAPLAYYDIGAGKPVLLIHAFASNAEKTWLKNGIASQLVESGRRIIAPDLRGHGASRETSAFLAFPPDALALDMEHLLHTLAVSSFDLVGYSMGALTAVRMLMRGALPSRVVLGGLGLANVTHPGPVSDRFERLLRADPSTDSAARALQAEIVREELSAAELTASMRSFPDSSSKELQTITSPTLIICGDRDNDHGDPAALAALFRNARAERIKGSHTSALKNPEFAEKLIDFLAPDEHTRKAY